MAKELHQLDLFGNAHIAPVHIKRTKAHKVVAKKPLQMSAAVSEDHMMLNDEMPSVSRAPMHFGKNNTNHKSALFFQRYFQLNLFQMKIFQINLNII